MIKRIIPSSGEEIPVLGMGTWKTFDVEAGTGSLKPLTEVLGIMQQAGGTLIDSSPMYGKAEATIGALTSGISTRNDFFYATKVWTNGKQEGIRQMNESFSKMKRNTMDLMQIHNLTDWKTQIKTLKEWKAAGKIRYLGITHYTDSMHEELERVFSLEEIDFVQFNYSVFSRHAENRLLQAAADRGVATLINRPLGEGRGLLKLTYLPLPDWAKENGIESWSQFVLLYLVLHPAVTVVIPATGNPLHAQQNYRLSDLPDFSFRKQLLDYINQQL
ncbi:MAG: aldo/keto reductase [Chitinophagaceae bacterium]|nr:aldo/keto reductase [Chitinophagaceae bacterium]